MRDTSSRCRRNVFDVVEIAWGNVVEIRSMRRRIFYEIIKKCQRNVVDMSTNPRVTSVECSTVVDFFRF